MNTLKQIFIAIGFSLVLFGAFGLGYYNRQIREPQSRDYQIELTNERMYIYDNQRLVDSCEYGNGKLDSIFLKDNY